ncbi:TPA: DNA-binding response regulator [Bacillus thuringiensis]|nr:DNA-binding response regulator [Bacillus thuringiensis]HDR8186688.1 DNA-binding response regulator [Bacillus thuringiensis]
MQRTILIVEDEDILREIMKDYLLNEGYNVLEAIDGKDINLTHTEFEIVTYFMRNQGIVISGEQLINKILGYEFAGDDRTINSHIRNLCHKLGQKAACIVTVVRAGYKFEGQV